MTENVAEHKQCSNSRRKTIKQAKCGVESQFYSSGWQGLQTITDYKRKTSHVTDTNVLLLDKLNMLFSHFEENTVSPTWPATSGRHELRYLNVLTLTRLPAQTASLFTSSEHGQTSWLVCLRTYSISPYLSLQSPHVPRWPPLFLYPRIQM